MPVPAVMCGGRPTVSSGSPIARLGIRCGLKITVLRLVFVIVMTADRDTSLPVPDVVAMAIYGGTFARNAAAAVEQIVVCGQRFGVRDHEPDGLGRIERRAAAQPDDAVAEVLPVRLHAVQHVLFGGIGRDGGECHRARQQARHALEHGRARQACIRDQQRMLDAAALQFRRQFVHGAGPEANRGRKCKGGEVHIDSR